jgi:hypothetical protein
MCIFLFLQYTPEESEIEPENCTIFPYTSTYANAACRMYCIHMLQENYLTVLRMWLLEYITSNFFKCLHIQGENDLMSAKL